MRLYHFCAGKHLKSIQKAGLKIGMVCVPTEAGFRMYSGYIWLTTNPDPRAQSWATRHLVKYCRTEYRLTVEIPEEAEERVLDREALEAKLPGSGQLFEGWKGSENWRVFRGRIPPEWIVEARRTKR